MARYLAMRIYQGALDYNAVIARYAKYKTAIDQILKELDDE